MRVNVGSQLAGSIGTKLSPCTHSLNIPTPTIFPYLLLSFTKMAPTTVRPSPTTSRRKKAFDTKSVVAVYYGEVPIDAENNLWKCNICGNIRKTDIQTHGYTNLMGHIKAKHNDMLDICPPILILSRLLCPQDRRTCNLPLSPRHMTFTSGLIGLSWMNWS